MHGIMYAHTAAAAAASSATSPSDIISVAIVVNGVDIDASVVVLKNVLSKDDLIAAWPVSPPVCNEMVS
jgi:hypothetical protein